MKHIFTTTGIVLALLLTSCVPGDEDDDSHEETGSKLILSLKGSATGWEPWVTDGTTSNTHLLKDIVPGQDGSLPSRSDARFLRMGSYHYFAANDGIHGDGLWKSDGTQSGTTRITDLRLGPTELTDVNGTLFFRGYVTNDEEGSELWKSDGTRSGTTRITDLRLGPTELTDVNGTLFFRGYVTNDEEGSELWKSDGTADGTVMLKFFEYGPDQCFPRNLTAVGDTLFFTGSDNTHKIELWKSDGTPEGTVMVKNIYPGDDNGEDGSVPANLTNVNGTLFFTAYDRNGTELWKSDGTAEGTVRVKDIYPGSRGSTATELVKAGNKLFFRALGDFTYGKELWMSDGTAEGTIMVKDIYAGPGNSSPSGLTDVNGTLYFNAYTEFNGTELWKSDGTAEGTVQVKNINPTEEEGSSPSSLTAVKNKLFFIANDGKSGQELWVSDGTATGTVMVKDINPSGDADIHIYGILDDLLIFSALDNEGRKLWKSDGTASGTTVLVADGLE